jgi:uncharacterized membrane protein (DUF4010 family)
VAPKISPRYFAGITLAIPLAKPYDNPVLEPLPTISFPYRDVAFKVALAGGIGLLVGLEREWSHKEIGVRTFAIGGLLGLLTSLLAPLFVVAGLSAVLLLIAFLNVHSLLKDRSLELTTSLCLVVVFFLGAMVGQGHYFTASTSAIAMMMLLAWKVELERLAGALRPEEIRSAVLLGLISVVIYPLLPDRFVDPFHLINPREAWVMVAVIAGIGFLNYVLLRVYSNRGLYYAALLGGLVNSTAAVAELSLLLRPPERSAAMGAGVLQLTNASMFVRNAVILAIFAPKAVYAAGSPLIAMAAAAILFAWVRHGSPRSPAPLRLSSPVSLPRVLKFGLIFLGLSCAGTIAQRHLGTYGFLVVSVAGGLISSASTTATAAALAAAGTLSPQTAGLATVLTSISSALMNLPLVYQQTRRRDLLTRLAVGSAFVVLAGVAVSAADHWLR